MSAILKGAESEAMFVYVALRQGWEISEPVHHSPHAYDFIVRRHSKKWETVQVKTAWCATKKKRSEIRITLRKSYGNKTTAYKSGDFDLLCVVYYDDMWLIPWVQVKRNTTVVVSSEKYDAYKMNTSRGIKPKVVIPRRSHVRGAKPV